MRDVIIFDMDGLMIDSERYYWAAERELAAQAGKPVDDGVLGSMMGRKPVESMRLFKDALGLSESAEELVETRAARVVEMMRASLDPMPGLMELLARFHGAMTLAIATSAPRTMVDVMAEKLGIERYFSLIQTCDDVVNGKPDPEIYLKAMSKLGVSADRCVVLEDSGNGALAGKRAGAYTIAVPTEHTRGHDFSFVDLVAADLFAAAERIERLRTRGE